MPRVNARDLLKPHQGQREHTTSSEGLSRIKENQLWKKKKKKRLQKQKRWVVWGMWQKHEGFTSAASGSTFSEIFQGISATFVLIYNVKK